MHFGLLDFVVVAVMLLLHCCVLPLDCAINEFGDEEFHDFLRTRKDPKAMFLICKPLCVHLFFCLFGGVVHDYYWTLYPIWGEYQIQSGCLSVDLHC